MADLSGETKVRVMPLIKAGQRLLSAQPPGRPKPQLAPEFEAWEGDAGPAPELSEAHADGLLRASLLGWQLDERGALQGAPDSEELAPLPARFANMEEYVAAFSGPLLCELFEEVRAKAEQARSLNALGVSAILGAVHTGAGRELLLMLRPDPHSVGHAPLGRSGRGRDGGGREPQPAGAGGRPSAADASQWARDELVILSADEPVARARAPLLLPPPPPQPQQPPSSAPRPALPLPPPPPRPAGGGAASAARGGPGAAEREEGECEEGELEPDGAPDAEAPGAAMPQPQEEGEAGELLEAPTKRHRPTRAPEAPHAAGPAGIGSAGADGIGALLDPRRRAPSYAQALGETHHTAAPARRAMLALVLRAVKRGGREGGAESWAELAISDSPAARELLSARERSDFRLRAQPIGSVATCLREWRALQRVGGFALLQELLPRPSRPGAPPSSRPPSPALVDPRLAPRQQPQPQPQPHPQPQPGDAPAPERHASPHLELLVGARRLNESQAGALRAGCGLRSGTSLVVGPPGSGKSTVVLALLNALHTAAFHSYYQSLLHGACTPGFFAGATGAAGAAACALLEARQPRLLLCAPSNVAVDELLGRLMAGGFVDARGGRYNPALLRVGGGATSAGARQVSVEERSDGLLRAIAADEPAAAAALADAERLAAEGARELGECVRVVEQRIRACGGPASPAWHAEKEAHAGALTAQWEKWRRARADAERWRVGTDGSKSVGWRRQELRSLEIGSAQIVFATLAAAGSELVQRCGHPFQTVLIDEACQATEPAAIVALQYRARRLLLFGDPAQLPATVLSRRAERCGLGRSLFERLQANGEGAALLSVQYRMHPAIAAFPCRRFYGGQLASPPSVDPRERPPPAALAARARLAAARCEPYSPYAFYHVGSGSERRAGAGGQSVANAAEAAFCALLLQRLLAAPNEARRLDARGADGAPEPPPANASPFGGASVAVLSPYAAQVQTIRTRLRQALGAAAAELVEVNTIDGFQGREKDIVLFSATRAPAELEGGRCGIGFVADVRRMNVGLTRARHAMWVVGHAPTLERGSEDWRALVHDAKERRVFIDAEQVTGRA